MNATQQHNVDAFIERSTAAGITNPNTIAAELSVIGKESNFIPQNENLSYTAKRIMEVWKDRISAATAKQLENNPIALGNYVYGPKFNPSLGNAEGEGYKYRGRGYNQITGRANYKKIGQQIGVDLVANPDLLNDPKNAAAAAVIFFQNGVKSLSQLGKLGDYHATGINDFKTPQDSLGAIYHVNAGVGKTKAKVEADTTGGRKKAIDAMPGLLAYVNAKMGVTAPPAGNAAPLTETAAEAVKKNPLITILVVAGGIVLIYLAIKHFKKQGK